MFKIITLLTALFILSGCFDNEPQAPFSEGQHYTKLAQHERSKTNQIVKFVSFACPACRSFEDAMSDYTPPAGTMNERIPVRLGNDSWIPLVRAYAVMRLLEVHDDVASDLFVAVQQERVFLGNRESLAMWLKLKAGVDPKKTSQVYRSKELDNMMTMYLQAEARYNISFIPQIIVNGVYRVNLRSIDGETDQAREAQLYALLDYLVALP